MKHRHHLYPHAARLSLPGGGARLVQPVRLGLGALEHARYWLLPGALEGALRQGQPTIFNTDQGVQFTSAAYTERLEQAGTQISWDRRGRALDNIFVERLWRSVKWEEMYLHDYQTVADAYDGLDRYFRFYNHERPHQALSYQTPAQVHGMAS